MSIVGRGLPDGPIVTGGMGLSEPVAPGVMSALLVGVGSATASLDVGADAAGTVASWFRLPPRQPPRRVSTYVNASAVLVGTGALAATAEAEPRHPGLDDLSILFALELV